MIENEAELAEKLQESSQFKFDLDTYKLLLKAFNSPKTQVIQFNQLAV